MTTLPEDIKTFIAASTAVSSITSRIHYNHIPQQSATPHIWFRLASDNEEIDFDQAGGLHESMLDVECVADSETTAQSLVDAVKSRLHGYRGAMGNSSAQGIFVSDKDDSYQPRSDMSDEGRSVCALEVQCWYTT